MPSLERFFPPIARFFDTNIKSLPNARLYFFKANSTTLKATFKDKVGDIAHANPVEADASGYFPPIFLSGLYRVELRNKDNIVQPGWPVDNVGQDSAIVPFAPWSEIVTYQTDDVVTSPDGFWFRSTEDNNLGLDPDDNSGPGGEWELIVIPIAANFETNVNWLTFTDSGTKLSLDISGFNLVKYLRLLDNLIADDDLHALPAPENLQTIEYYSWLGGIAEPQNSPESGAGFAERLWLDNNREVIIVTMAANNNRYIARKATTWGPWETIVKSGPITSSTLTMNSARILGRSGASSGAIEELTGASAALILEETDIVELGGDFPAGESIQLTKIGNTVSITTSGGPTSGALDHALGTFADSVAGIIPAKYRPSSTSGNVYHVDADAIRRVSVSTGGTLSLAYWDYTGTPYSSSSSETSPIITYTV